MWTRILFDVNRPKQWQYHCLLVPEIENNDKYVTIMVTIVVLCNSKGTVIGTLCMLPGLRVQFPLRLQWVKIWWICHQSPHYVTSPRPWLMCLVPNSALRSVMCGDFAHLLSQLVIVPEKSTYFILGLEVFNIHPLCHKSSRAETQPPKK